MDMRLYERLKATLYEESRKHGWGIILIAREQLKRILLERKPRKLLDIGCHNRLLESTIKQWLSQVKHRIYTVGLDIVVYKVKPEVIASGDLLPFRDSSFDFITMIETIEHIPDYVCCLKQCFRILKKSGGIFIQSVSCLSPHSWKGDPTHLHVIHPDTLERLMKWIGFDVREKGLIKNTFYLYAVKP